MLSFWWKKYNEAIRDVFMLFINYVNFDLLPFQRHTYILQILNFTSLLQLLLVHPVIFEVTTWVQLVLTPFGEKFRNPPYMEYFLGFTCFVRNLTRQTDILLNWRPKFVSGSSKAWKNSQIIAVGWGLSTTLETERGVKFWQSQQMRMVSSIIIRQAGLVKIEKICFC